MQIFTMTVQTLLFEAGRKKIRLQVQKCYFSKEKTMPRYSNRYSDDFHDWSDSRMGRRKGAVYAPASDSESVQKPPKSEPDDSDWKGWLALCQKEGWLYLVMEEQGWLAFKMGCRSYLTLLSLEGNGEKYEYSLDKEENPVLESHLSCWMTEPRYQENFNRAARLLFD